VGESGIFEEFLVLLVQQVMSERVSQEGGYFGAKVQQGLISGGADARAGCPCHGGINYRSERCI